MPVACVLLIVILLLHTTRAARFLAASANGFSINGGHKSLPTVTRPDRPLQVRVELLEAARQIANKFVNHLFVLLLAALGLC